MAATRYEARGNAREPDGGTPGCRLRNFPMRIKGAAQVGAGRTQWQSSLTTSICSTHRNLDRISTERPLEIFDRETNAMSTAVTWGTDSRLQRTSDGIDSSSRNADYYFFGLEPLFFQNKLADQIRLRRIGH